MKTKTIPFDLDMAKKIQAGEIKGKVYFKIKTADRSETYTFNLKTIHRISNLLCPYYGVFECNGEDCIQYIRSNGYIPEQLVYLIIEVPDNGPQFKPFDKVLVRNKETDTWHPSLYATTDGLLYYTIDCKNWCQCVKHEGNEHLVGTTDNPKED